MKIFARHFRGFKKIEIDLKKTYFLVGDNSSGKSSFLYLIDAVCESSLNFSPKIDEDFGASRYDYFSPYFDYKDVDFAVLDDSGSNGGYVKFITVRRRPGDHPQIIRCTHWYNGHYVALKVTNGKVFCKAGQFESEVNFQSLLKLHSAKMKAWSKTDIKKSSISEGAALLAIWDTTNKEQQRLVVKAYGFELKSCRFVSPLRALPERFYSSVRKVDAAGGHFAKVWLDLSVMGESVLAEIDKFGSEAKLFDRLHVEEVETTVDDPPLLVTVEKYGKRFTLDQVGIGVSQVVPLLIDTVFSLEIDQKPVLSQQPELHLHPVAQSALGSYLYRAHKSGLKAVYETHSSFLLDRFKADFRDDEERPSVDGIFENVSVLFFRNGKEGNQLVDIKIKDDGSLQNDPEDYHEFFLNEIVRTMF